MGEVFVAFDTTLQRRVALKAVRQDRQLNEEGRARLLREARILSQLDHPGICRVHDYVSDGDTDYLVLELIDGQSLRDAMRQPMDRAVKHRISEQIAQALVVAHAAGIVHRDLKPENVMLLTDGSAKVLDFGLARSFDAPLPVSGAMASRLPSNIGAQFDSAGETIGASLSRSVTLGSESPVATAHGILMGTPAYMSPEQAAGEVATAPSDMYAFGLLLQELHTGTPAYDLKADLPTLLDKVRRGDTRPPAGVARDLGDLLGQLKAVAPSQRPTAVDVVERLRRIREKPARRLRFTLAAALVVVAIVGGVKYTIDLGRERNAAVLAREDANRRRDQAEILIGFMLGDLRGKLQGVGRLDLLDAVGEKAMAYFAAVPASALSDEEVSRRSQAIYQIGEVSRQKGDLKAASARFTESLELIAALAQRAPQNPRWQIDLATSHFYAGDALRLQGDLDGAMRHFSAYRDIGDALAARTGAKPEWLLESSYGHSNVAAVLESKGDFDGARRELERCIDINEQLLGVDPKNAEFREALANVRNRLAVVLEKLGDGRGALEQHLQSFQLRKLQLEDQPDDAGAERRMAVAASWVATMYRDQGEMARSWEYANIRLTRFERLVARDPANADWQRELGVASIRVANLYRLNGALRDAEARAIRGLAILRPLALKDPSHLRRQFDVVAAEVEWSAIQLAAGRIAAAHATAITAAPTIEGLMRKSPRDIDLPRLLAEARTTAAEALVRMGQRGKALAQLEEARASLEPRAGAIQERRFRHAWARVLRGLGRTQEAEAVAAQLRESGFRPFVP